jgi:hypothetical protein
MTTTPIYDKVFATLQARAALNGAQLVRTDPAHAISWRLAGHRSSAWCARSLRPIWCGTWARRDRSVPVELAGSGWCAHTDHLLRDIDAQGGNLHPPLKGQT